MRALLRLAAIAAAALFAAGATGAAEVGGVKLDDKVSLAGREAALNGAGVRVKVFLKIYVVSLYLPQPAKDLNARKYASWTTSCASCSLRSSHLARL